MAKERNSFIMYYDFAEQTATLTDAQVGRLLRIILDYEKWGVYQETEDPAVMMAFRFLKVGLDQNAEKYEKVCQRNRENRLGRSASSPVVASGTDPEPEPDTDTESKPDTEPET